MTDARRVTQPHPTYIDPGIGGRCRSDSVAVEHGPPDRGIAALAERQHGVVARRQLLDAGIGPHAIDVRLARGSLLSIHHGVYAVGHADPGRSAQWMAAVLACGPGAILSHLAAARCWGLLRGTGVPEVTRPGKFRQRRGIIARFASVPADERGICDGIPITSVSRTILDLAAVGTTWQVRRAMHEAEIRQLTDRLSVPDLLRRYPRRQGSKLLREVVGDAEYGTPANDFEDRFAELVLRSELPKPRFNRDLMVAGRHLRPDCLWPGQRLIVELDGRKAHDTRQSFESDRERDRVLMASGWRVIRVTWRQLRDDPDAVIADLRRALQATRPTSTPK